jgi:hypothetical protein
MRAGRVLLVALCSGAALFAVTPAADAASTKAGACKALNKLDRELSNVNFADADADSYDQDAFAEIGDAFQDAADSKKTPKQLKSALTTIGTVYEDLGDSDDYVAAVQTFGRNGAKWTKALGTWTTYMATNCT